MPPQTRRLAAIRKNLDHVARSAYMPASGGSSARFFETVKQAMAYVRAGQRLCIDCIPTEPVLQVRVCRRSGGVDRWIVHGSTPRRSFRVGIYVFNEHNGNPIVVLDSIGGAMPCCWLDRIDRRIEWRRQDIITETLALAMHPRIGRDSPVLRAVRHPLFDKHIFTTVLNGFLGRLSGQRNKLL
jgi:hypothetical protein